MPKIDIRNIDIEELPEPRKEKFIKRKNREEKVPPTIKHQKEKK